MKKTETKQLLDKFVNAGFKEVGLKEENDASIEIHLQADSGYQTSIKEQRINPLQWYLIQSILNSDIGKQKKKPKAVDKRYPLFAFFQ